MLNRPLSSGRSLLVGALLAGLSTQTAMAQQADAPAASGSATSQAPCMARQNPDGTTASIRVAADEAADYEALGYRAVACATENLAAIELGAICRVAAVAPVEGRPYLTEYYGVTIDALCQSARRAGAALGVVLDEADRRPDWARQPDGAATSPNDQSGAA